MPNIDRGWKSPVRSFRRQAQRAARVTPDPTDVRSIHQGDDTVALQHCRLYSLCAAYASIICILLIASHVTRFTVVDSFDEKSEIDVVVSGA